MAFVPSGESSATGSTGGSRMHIPDAVLEPRVVATTGVLGAAGLAYCLRQADKQLRDRTTPYMGILAAFIFAAQMVNFPVGPGVSGHLLGGVLAAVALGPWAGAVVIGAVLIVQCFLFGDGGLSALGANFVNMGLIGSIAGYAIYAPLQRWIGGRRGILIGSMVAAWFTVLLASGACATELSISGSRSEFFRLLSWMALVHAAIGVGEAIITGLVVRFVLLTRPELIDSAAGHNDNSDGLDAEQASKVFPSRWPATVIGGLGIALAVAVFLSPFASEYPDGLEFVGEKVGILSGESGTSLIPSPMPDYRASMAGLDRIEVATAVAGLVGTLVVFGVSWGLARIFAGASSRPERVVADAT